MTEITEDLRFGIIFSQQQIQVSIASAGCFLLSLMCKALRKCTNIAQSTHSIRELLPLELRNELDSRVSKERNYVRVGGSVNKRSADR